MTSREGQEGQASGMRIGELARRAGVTPRAVRHYEQFGVLDAPARTGAGYRIYGRHALERLAFVAAARQAGFSLAEIRDVVALRARGESPCAHVAALVDHHRARVDAAIRALAAVRAELDEMAERARDLDPADCGDAAVCRIVTTTTVVRGRTVARGG